jgi:hypothetical protein
MKSSFLLIIPALLVALFSSCKKDDGSHNTTTPGSYRSLDEAMLSTAPKAKSTSLIVASGDTLYSYGGTRFIIPPNVFETLNGGKVTGSVNITIQDWLKKGDMIFGRVLPLNYGAVLNSGGEAFIQVTQNGQVLRIRKDTFITVQFPQFGSGLTGLTGWTGRAVIGSANTVNWLPADPTQIAPGPNTADSIAVICDTLHYIQAANPLTASTYANFTVKVTGPVELEQSMAYAMYDNIKAVFPLPSVTNGQVNAVQVPLVPSVPMHIAVMGINKGQFFGGFVAVDNPQSDSTYTVKLTAQEPPTVRLQMNSY